MLVHDLDRRHAGGQRPQRVVLVALDLGPEPVWSGDDKAEIADLRDIDPRIIDLVDDAKSEREPQPRRPERAADDILRAARPGRRNARRTGGMTGGFGRRVAG